MHYYELSLAIPFRTGWVATLRNHAGEMFCRDFNAGLNVMGCPGLSVRNLPVGFPRRPNLRVAHLDAIHVPTEMLALAACPKQFQLLPSATEMKTERRQRKVSFMIMRAAELRCGSELAGSTAQDSPSAGPGTGAVLHQST